MNADEARALCLAQPGAEETFPFGPEYQVYKVMGKMFALLPLAPRPAPAADAPTISTKAEPYFGQLLRETYAGVEPAYHFNKRHWIQTRLDGSVPPDEVRAIIEHSYRQVVKGLTRAQRAALAQQVDGAA